MTFANLDDDGYDGPDLDNQHPSKLLALRHKTVLGDSEFLSLVSAFLEDRGLHDQFEIDLVNWMETHPSRVYNPKFENNLCICGHPYYRHFDGYENNRMVGCKYCQCYDFQFSNPE